MFPVFTGYLVLCDLGCEDGSPQQNTSLWSDVVIFGRQSAEIFSEPFSLNADALARVLLCGTDFNNAGCLLPDESHPDKPTVFLNEQGIEDVVELTVYSASILQSGGPVCCGINTFNIYSDGTPEPATWTLLAGGLAIVAASRLRRMSL
jgi:hypothetical protein